MSRPVIIALALSSLVLLAVIGSIVTRPIPTHAVKLDLPPPSAKPAVVP